MSFLNQNLSIRDILLPRTVLFCRMVMSVFIFSFIVMVGADYKLQGYPNMQNCPESYEFAKELKVTSKDQLTIFPRWYDPSKKDKFTRDPLNNYTWTYKMAKVIGKGNERPLDMSKWLTHYGQYIVIPPHSLSPGYYKLYISAKLKNPADMLKPVDRNLCHFTYASLPPVIVISGGSYRSVGPSTEIKLTAEDSFDPNEKIRTNADFQYKWRCTQKKTPPTFCNKNPISVKSSLEIPGRFMEVDEKFTIFLTIQTGSNSSGTANQTIEVLDNAAQIEITCEKNCPPAAEKSNGHYLTYLRAKCVSNCRGLKDEHYEWTVQQVSTPNFKFDYGQTQFGQRSPKFIILKDIMTAGEYEITVKLRPSAPHQGSAKIFLHFLGPPNVASCFLIPRSGQSMLTLFKIRCNQKGVDRTLYEIIVKDRDDSTKQTIVMEQYFPEIFYLGFQLPPSDKHIFEARVSFHGGPSTHAGIAGTVTKSSVSVDAFDQFYNGKGNVASIPDLLSSNNTKDMAAGLRKFHAFIDQLVITNSDDKETQAFIQDLKYKVAKDILKAPISSLNEVDRMGQDITKLMSQKEPPQSDPLLAKFSTTICKKMVDKHFNLIKEGQFPLNLAVKAAKVSATLSQCLETNTNPNFKAVAPIDINITTEAPTITEMIATENYANYVDFDENYYKNLENLKESTYNIISATRVSAKSIAMTTAAGEKFVEIYGKKSATIVAKDEGKVLAESRLQSQGVTLVPSKDFAGDDHHYDILLSTWTKDIFWWNVRKTEVSTDIVSVEYWHSTCRQKLEHFKEPVQLIFNINEDKQSVKYIEDTFKVPDGFSSLTGDDLSRVIRVRRVAVPKGRTLRVQFANLTKTDTLEVIITNFKFPTAEDFGNSTTVTSDGDLFLFFINPEDYDVWCYVGVLANKTLVSRNLKSLDYKLSTTMTSCIRWAESKNIWEPSCRSGRVGNQSTISCQCNNFSVIAGYLEEIQSIPQEVILPDVELTLESTLVIFVTLSVTLGIYCCIIICTKTKKETLAYYLSDNNSKHRFAYLLSIRTGGGRNSGTTSNLTIRLVGENHSSDPHVLNYPDPKLRLLQRFNQDTFLLTTKHHLGQLQKIELWFDCLGPSPDWFCKDITIYDMQQYSEWYWKVRRRLAVIKGDSYVELSPTTTVSPHRFKFDWRYHTWYLCHGEVNFSYVKRITVLLSTILMMYVSVLVLLGVPSMTLQDALDRDYRIEVFTLVWAVIGSFPSFVLHSILVWCFRFSKPQYPKYEQEERKSFKITIICWIVLIVIITTCVSILIVFGFWVPHNKSLLWLTTNAFGLGCILIVYENIFVFLQSIFCKLELKYNIRLKFQDIHRAIEGQRETLHKNFGDGLLRPYFGHLYEPLKSKTIKEKKVFVAHRRNVIAELEDLVMFSIYVIILYVVILANKDNLIVRGRTEMQEIMEGKHTKTLDFRDIESIREYVDIRKLWTYNISFHSLYDYINITLIPSMQPSRWYGNYVITEPAMMIDMTNKYIGVARIRQQRIKSNVCTIVEPMRFVQNSCHPEFSLLYSETRPFGYERQANMLYFHQDRLRDIWSYSGVGKTGSLGTAGEFATYTGGGNLAYLGRTLYNSYTNFRKIFEKFWIDHKSRSVFIEFLTYNVNYNVFSSVKLLFEQSATGYTFKHVEVFAVRMLFVENSLTYISTVFFFLFMAWVGMLMLRQSIDVMKKIRSFYKEIWFLIDGLIIVMSLICIALFLYRMSMIETYLNKLETMKHNEFLNYFYLFYLEVFLTIFAAVLVCVATIRLWKFLRFGLIFRILERTLSKAAVPLASVTVAFAIIVTDFAMVIVSLYGSEFEKVNTVVRTVRLLTTMFLRAGEMEMSQFTTYKSAFFYFALYSFVLKFTFVIFVMIIVMSYSEAQMEFSEEPDAYNIKHYVQERMRYIPRFIKYKFMRQRGGEEEVEDEQEEERSKVVPKPDKFLYVNVFSVSTDRIKTMICMTQCVIRNMKRSNNSGVKLMLSVCRQLLRRNRTDEVEIFFKGCVEGRRLALIDEKRIINVARAASMLVEEPTGNEVVTSKSTPFDKHDQMIVKNQDCLKRCNLSLQVILHKISSVEVMFSRINK